MFAASTIQSKLTSEDWEYLNHSAETMGRALVGSLKNILGEVQSVVTSQNVLDGSLESTYIPFQFYTTACTKPITQFHSSIQFVCMGLSIKKCTFGCKAWACKMNSDACTFYLLTCSQAFFEIEVAHLNLSVTVFFKHTISVTWDPPPCAGIHTQQRTARAYMRDRISPLLAVSVCLDILSA